MLLTRTLTGAGIVAGTVLVLIFSGNTLFLKCVAGALSLMGIFELYRATGAGKKRTLLLLSGLIALVLCFADIPRYGAVVGCVFLAAVAVFGYYMASTKTKRGIGTAMSVALAAAITVFLKTMVSIRGMENGGYLLAMSMFLCNVCDAAAYLVGRSVGKRKLAPEISPNKTVGGSIGGVVMTLLVFLFLAWALERGGVLSFRYGVLAVYLLLASVVCQLGDLSFSALKRIVGTKDYGKLLPGHGGILDRFDSLLFVLPYTYLFLLLAGPIILP